MAHLGVLVPQTGHAGTGRRGTDKPLPLNRGATTASYLGLGRRAR